MRDGGNFSAMMTTFFDASTYAPSSQPIITTLSFGDADTVGIVRKTRAPKELFAWIAPFSPGLWVCVMVFTVVAAGVMNALAWLGPAEEEGGEGEAGCTSDSGGNFAVTFYHSWAILLGGEDYEFLTVPLKILRLGMLLFVLILVSTYTANLASFFTKPSWIISGPKDMQGLKTSRACVDWQIDQEKSAPFVGSLVSAYGSVCSQADVDAQKKANNLLDPNLTPCTKVGHVLLVDRFAHCQRLLQAGLVDVWLTQEPIGQIMTLNHCDKYSIVPTIRVSGFNMGVAMLDSPTTRSLLIRLNDVIATLHFDPWFYNLQSSEWGIGKSCQEAVSDLEPVGLDSMVGLFLVPISTSLIALGLAIWLKYKPHEEEEAGTEEENLKSSSIASIDLIGIVPDHNASEGELLRWLVKAEKIRQREKVQREQDDGGGEEGPVGTGMIGVAVPGLSRGCTFALV